MPGIGARDAGTLCSEPKVQPGLESYPGPSKLPAFSSLERRVSAKQIGRSAAGWDGLSGGGTALVRGQRVIG